MVIDAPTTERRTERAAFTPTPPELAARPAGPRPPARVALALAEGLALALYALGWLAGALLWPVVFGLRWAWAGLATGWDDAVAAWHRNGGSSA